MWRKSSNPNSILRYSGLVFQLFGTLALAAFIGNKLDKLNHNDTPLFTILAVILAFIALMVWLYKDVQRTKND